MSRYDIIIITCCCCNNSSLLLYWENCIWWNPKINIIIIRVLFINFKINTLSKQRRHSNQSEFNKYFGINTTSQPANDMASQVNDRSVQHNILICIVNWNANELIKRHLFWNGFFTVVYILNACCVVIYIHIITRQK